MPAFRLFLVSISLLLGTSTPLFAARIEIASLAELERYAAESGNEIVMRPGLYRLIDHIPLDSIPARRARKQWPFFVFSGDDNTFRLEGVVIEHDTALRAALRPPVHTNEFVVAGARNTLSGLAITCIGDGTSPGGALVSVTGENNTLLNCVLTVRGSFPYGYGDLFGKGGPNVINHRKHSGLLVTGRAARLLGCKVVMRSFGHAFFIQGGSDQVFENCVAEGEARSTTAMLAETSGPAFDVGFRTINKNREGAFHILPGYSKSLAEDGFRTYGDISGLVFKNCVARDMRGGFELRTKRGVRLENCTALGCERGFWLADDAVLVGGKGDARHGPLLFVEGKNARAEIELLPAESDAVIHALALIHGEGHAITLRASSEGERTKPLPIRLGAGAPGAGEGMSAIPLRPARDLVLRNETAMPVEVGPGGTAIRVASRGPVFVAPDAEANVTVEKIP